MLVIFFFTFIIEAIDSVNGGRFVISSEQEEILGIFHFIRKHETDSLQTVLASVNIVAQKQIICFWWKSTVFKQSQQVLVLSMNITLYSVKMGGSRGI